MLYVDAAKPVSSKGITRFCLVGAVLSAAITSTMLPPDGRFQT